jgi:hypothetical protein
MFGTPVAATILASVHVRAHQQAGHMDARDLIKTLQNALRGEGRPHMNHAVRAILDICFGTRLLLRRQRQARDAPWSCGNQPAYHSMINRRTVPALHRACLHQGNQPAGK